MSITENKLNLNKETINKAREHAREITRKTQEYIDIHTTVTVERTICRLMGIDGIDENNIPLPNIVVDSLQKNGVLSVGAAYYLGSAMVNTGLSPQAIAERISKDQLDIVKLPSEDIFEIKRAVNAIAEEIVEKIRKNRIERNNYLKRFGD